MRSKSILMSASLVATLTIGTISPAFAQAPVTQNRIAQQVVIGGLRVDAATVIAPNGGVQSYSCPGPQQYVTPDGGSQGWACFDRSQMCGFSARFHLSSRRPRPSRHLHPWFTSRSSSSRSISQRSFINIRWFNRRSFTAQLRESSMQLPFQIRRSSGRRQ